MKFLIVNKFLYPNGGSETYIFGLGRQLEAMGHEVQYFGMEHPDRCVGNSVGAYTSNMDFHGGSTLSKLALPFKIIYSSEARRQIRKVLDDLEPDVVHLNNINFQITPSIIYEIRKWDRDRSRRATGSGTPVSGEPGAAGERVRTRIVYTAHDYQWICPNHMLYILAAASAVSDNADGGDSTYDTASAAAYGCICEACSGGRFAECAKHCCIHGSRMRSILGSIEGYYYKWRKTYSMVDTIICPSRFLYDRFAAVPLLKDKLVMMHNFIETGTDETAADDIAGADDRAVSSRPEPAHTTTDTAAGYVLYFGRFAFEKGIATLAEAAGRLPDIPFIFAGSGPMEAMVRKLASDRDNVSFVGFKTGSELKRLISDAAFSIYPSEWYENCPFSVMESIRSGTPVIGADIGGIPELIVDPDSSAEDENGASGTGSAAGYGLLFKPGDTDDLTEKIRLLWNDRELTGRLSYNCGRAHFDTVAEYAAGFLGLI